MNIALVSPFRLKEQAGVTTLVSRLQDALIEHGHRALVLEPGDEDWIVDAPATHGQERYTLNLRRLYAGKQALLKRFIAFWAYLPLSLYDVWMFLRKQNIHILHVHFPTPATLYFCALRPISKWRLVMTFHGSDVYSLARRSQFYRWLLACVASRADFITAVSRDVLRALETAYPVLPTRRRVILNGNPLSDHPYLSATARGPHIRPYVLAVGSLIPRKAYDVLLRALALARQRGHELSTVIVGGGPEEGTLSTLARDLKVSDIVTLAGEVNHDKIGSFYAGASFFAHPAREEAQGLVLLEAMSFGLPVVASRVNGIPEVVRDGETGLLVPPDDPEALAAALITLAENPLLRNALGARARALVETEHSWATFTQKYLEVYEEVLRVT